MLTNDIALEKLWNLRQSSPTSVTSSHWSTVGGSSVIKTSNGWLLHGYAFGNYAPNTLKYKLGHLPKTFLCKKELKKSNCHPDIVKAAYRVLKKQNRLLTYDCVRQMLSLDSILRSVWIPTNVCVIGDGYGFLGSVLKEMGVSKVLSINLNDILFFDMYYTKMAFPEIDTVLMQDKEDYREPGLIFLRAEDFELLEGLSIDLYINICSFQEIEPSITKRYFGLMKTSISPVKYLYSCNREVKTLPDGVITHFSDIPWEETDMIFDEVPIWVNKFPKTKPPFWAHLDGSIRHRLVRL